MLANNGADLNIVYNEKTIEPEFSKTYNCPILINIVRQQAHLFSSESNLRPGLLGMVHFGARLDIPDSDGRDAMSYAVMSNNSNLVKFLIQNKDKCHLNINSVDLDQKNAVHYAINPCKFGSYENTGILEILHKNGFALDNEDKSGKKPLDYAKQQKSGVMLKKLLKLMERDREYSKMKTQTTYRKAADWPAL